MICFEQKGEVKGKQNIFEKKIMNIPKRMYL